MYLVFCFISKRSLLINSRLLNSKFGGCVRDLEFIKSLPMGVKHIGGGVAVPLLDPAAYRVRRHVFLSGAQELLYPFFAEKIDQETGEIKRRSEFRVSACFRSPVDPDGVKIYQNGQSIGYSGVIRCGNVWGCPICCAKVMRLRGEQISRIFESVHGEGGSAVLVTLTASHSFDQKLSFLLSAFKDAKRALSQMRVFRELIIDRLGAVSATEITWGAKSGWHPHQHDSWFFAKPVDADLLATQIFSLWKKACNSVGLKTLEAYRGNRVGVDVRQAWNAADYTTKFDRERSWSLAAEMTAGRLKMAQAKSMTPWALLEDSIIHGSGSASAALFIEYLRATKGKACISLKAATNLCERLGLPTSLNDFKDANEKGAGEIIGVVPGGQFDRVVRAGGLGELLVDSQVGLLIPV